MHEVTFQSVMNILDLQNCPVMLPHSLHYAPMAKSNPTLKLGTTATTRASASNGSLPMIYQGDRISGEDLVEAERKL